MAGFDPGGRRASGHHRRHRVVAVIYDRLALFELAIAVEVFGLPRPELEIPWYEFAVCSLDRGSLRATGAIRLAAPGGLRAIARADTVIIPGWRDPAEAPPARLLRALRRAHRRGARVVSICSGVFVLAAAGLLDGRRATTHWRYVERLRRQYPGIRVEPDALYVDDGNVFSSAGSAAGIDLCLHLVRLDHGAEIANQVARRFRAELGATPQRWLNHQRVLAAQRRLEGSREPIEDVAAAVGFGSAQTLRLHFRRFLRTSPTAYRLRFSTRARRRLPP